MSIGNIGSRYGSTTKPGKYLIFMLTLILCCTGYAYQSMAYIGVVGSGTGEVTKENDYEYTIYSPTSEHTVKFEEASDKPVRFYFSGWHCGIGVDRFYMHSRAVIKGATGWPEENLRKILNAIAEGTFVSERKYSSGEKGPDGKLKTATVRKSPYRNNYIKTAELFLKSQGTTFEVENGIELIVSNPGKREVNACYTSKEISSILDSVEQAVRNALNQKVKQK